MVCIRGIRGTVSADCRCTSNLRTRTCLETVHSDGLISEDLDRRTSIACTPACNHPTRNNESPDLLVPSRARLHTSYDSQFASMYRSIYAVTIRPKSLYEDVHASTGHRGYTGMQWHQKNSIGANYTDKDAAAPRGICQGCALGSAHQYPTNQHYVMSDTPHDPGSNSSLTHLHITELVTAAMYMLICSLTSPQDKSIPCLRSPS